MTDDDLPLFKGRPYRGAPARFGVKAHRGWVFSTSAGTVQVSDESDLDEINERLWSSTWIDEIADQGVPRKVARQAKWTLTTTTGEYDERQPRPTL